MTGDMEEFARQARAFLDSHAAPKAERAQGAEAGGTPPLAEFRWGESDDRVGCRMTTGWAGSTAAGGSRSPR
jgi:hypothetical protein